MHIAHHIRSFSFDFSLIFLYFSKIPLIKILATYQISNGQIIWNFDFYGGEIKLAARTLTTQWIVQKEESKVHPKTSLNLMKL